MAERYNVRVKVISKKGTCLAGHKVGDEWVIKSTTPEGMCISAYNSLFPNARTLMFGGRFPWEKEPGAITMGCHDPENTVVFELRRLTP